MKFRRDLHIRTSYHDEDFNDSHHWRHPVVVISSDVRSNAFPKPWVAFYI